MWSIILFGLIYSVRGESDDIQASLTVSEADVTPRHLGSLVEIAKLADHFTKSLDGLRYTQFTSGAGDLFTIDGVTGELTLIHTPDRELLCPHSSPGVVRECELPLLVSLSSTDDPAWLKVVRITVKITDTNDNAPVFPELVFNINVPENSPIGTEFHVSMATDVDTDVNGVKVYEITSSSSSTSINSPAPFELLTTTNSNDVIDSVTLALTSVVDRELVSGYTIEVVATDSGGLSGSLTIEVSITDVDDNIPKFSLPSKHLEVAESEQPGKVLLEVEAIDPDIGRNGQVLYTLTPSSRRIASDNIWLNSTTGHLTVGPSGLDFETRTEYELVIQVSAVNNPTSVTDSLTVYLVVLDGNDEVPLISVTSVNSELEENMAAGQRIALVSVTDSDTGKGGQFTCAISGESFLMRDMAQGVLVYESQSN